MTLIFGVLGLSYVYYTDVSLEIMKGIKHDTMIDNNEKIEKFKKDLKESKLTIFTGAGISKKCDLPDWNDLVRKLSLKIIETFHIPEDENSDSILSIIEDNLKEQENPLETARVLEGYDPERNFFELLHSVLYSNECCDDKIRDNPILDVLSKFLIKRINKRNINVITYNFDDCLERAIKLKQNNISLDSIYASKKTSSKKLKIFHVHGFIPYNGGKEMSSPYCDIILTEKNYNLLAINQNSWANSIQKRHIRNNCCLFVGFSLTDRNQRLLLDSLRKKNDTNNLSKLYAILPKEESHSIKDDKVSQIIKKFEYICFEQTEDLYRQFGITPIWYKNNEYSEIPKLLEKLLD